MAKLTEPFISFGVRQIVRDVGKPRGARFQLLDESQGLLHGLVHGMRNVTQSIQDQHVKAGQQRQGGVGNGTEVRQVRGTPETKTQDRKSTRLNSSHPSISYA